MNYTNSGWDFIDESTNGISEIWRLCTDGVHYPHLAWEFSKVGDISCPDSVQLEDIVYLADRWFSMTLESIGTADTNGDYRVDLSDFAIIAEYW